MKIVEINDEYKNFKIDDYDDLIQDSESMISVNRECLNSIEMIHGESCILAYYIVYLIVSSDSLIPNIKTPSNGLMFGDKSNNSKIGIYHAHLKDENVLIWYVEKNNSNDLILKVNCIQHPNKYEPILKEIMNSSNGYDTIRGMYFKDYIKDTYLKENKLILMFKDFLKIF